MTIVPFLNRINQYILNPLILLLFSIALAIFVYGIFQFVRNTGNEKAESYVNGKRAMLYGIIGMFVMVSAFAIIRFILAAFGLDADIYPLKQTP
jgi:hypothetical protein